MVDKLLRTPKHALMLPIAARLPARPGPITAAAFALGLGAAAAGALGAGGWALALWIGNRFLDGLDGEVARLHDRQSDLGGYLDILSDFAVYALLPLGLVLGADPAPGSGAWTSLAIMLAAFYLNAGSWMMLAAILEKRGRGAALRGERTSVTMPPALIEGAETVALFTLFLLLPGWLPWLFGITALLVAISALQRVAWAVRALGSER